MKKDVIVSMVKEIIENRDNREVVSELIDKLENEIKDNLGGFATVSVMRFDLLYNGYEKSVARRSYDIEAVNDFFKKHNIEVQYA